MRIAKSAKRLLSALTVTTLLVSGIVVAPKAKAAEGDPAVVVKGATLRLDGNDAGKQSMRIGVEVSNASKATECGIELDVGGTKTTISTADTKYQKIYDKDEEQDKIIYTVAIKNIPSNKFATDIKATGLVKTSGAAENTVSPAVTKNVNGIVEDLGCTLVDGNLTKELAKLDASNFDKDVDPFKAMYFGDPDKWVHDEYKDESQGIDDKFILSTVEAEKAYSITSIKLAGYKVSKTGTYIISGEAKASTNCTGIKVVRSDVNVKEISLNTTEYTPFSASVTMEEADMDGAYNKQGVIRLFGTAEDSNTPPTYLVRNLSVKKVASASDLKDMKLTRDINVDLTDGCVKNTSGKDTKTAYTSEGVKFTAKSDWSGGGIRVYINKDKSSLDLSSYSKLKINIDADCERALPILVELHYSDDKLNKKFGSKYPSTGNLEYDLSTVDDEVTTVFLKYNTYVPEGKTYGGPAEADFIVKSIEFLL